MIRVQSLLVKTVSRKAWRATLATALSLVVLAGIGETPLKAGGSDSRARCKATIRRGPEMGAEFRSIDDGSRLRFTVEVGDLADTANLQATVLRNGEAVPVFGPAEIPEALAPVGGAANGVADLNLDTQDGNLVPSLESGDVVSVSQNGAGLLSCTLQ